MVFTQNTPKLPIEFFSSKSKEEALGSSRKAGALYFAKDNSISNSPNSIVLNGEVYGEKNYDISDAVDSDRSDQTASSKAVKTAFIKADEVSGIASEAKTIASEAKTIAQGVETKITWD